MPSVDEQLREAREGARGSGRTHRMIMALPDRAIVIVPNASHGVTIRQLIERHRGNIANDAIVVVNVLNTRGIDSIRGTNRPIFVDHSFWELSPTWLCREIENLLHQQAEPESISDAPRYSMGLAPWLNVYGHHGGTQFMTPASIGRNAGRRAARIFGQTFDGPEAEDL